MTSTSLAVKHELRTTALPAGPAAMRAPAIRTMRRRLHASQAVFARFLNVSTQLVQAWEAGRRHPEGAALRLLDIARRDPAAVFAELLTPPPTASRRGQASAAAREARAAIPVRVMRQRDDVEGDDTLLLTPAERLSMMWPLAKSAWAFTGERARAESALSRHVVRVQRRAR